MEIRLAGIEPESIVDGPGYRLAVFVQGCPHGCPGCHNPGTHDPAGGYLSDTAAIIAQLGQNPLVRGVTLTGGEPMMQAAALCEVAAAARQKGLSVWCYTGYTLEALARENNPDRMRLLGLVDVLVDGRYVDELRNISLRFRGSSNQRIIDMNLTRRAGQIVLWEGSECR